MRIYPYIASAIMHGLAFGLLITLAPKAKKSFNPVEIRIEKKKEEIDVSKKEKEKKRKEKNEEKEEEKKKRKSKKKEEIIDLTKRKDIKFHRTEADVERVEDPKPQGGLTPESVVEESDFSVPIGNTLMAEPATKPEPVQFASIFEVTKMPQFRLKIKPHYPEIARKLGVEGLVILEVSISREGEVINAKVVNDPGHGLGEAALEAILRSSFYPAFSSDEPVAVKLRIPVRFKLVD